MTEDAVTLDRAAEAIEGGELVVYPTETVYGLGADACNETAIQAVFETKERAHDKPISMAVPDIEAAREYTTLTDREERFMEAFLPGPVTVVVEKRNVVPDALTGGRDRVGIRIPDNAIAMSLLERTAPITATSANVSGNPSARTLATLDDRVRDRAAVLVDGGETPGGGSTVVDVTASEIHRAGPQAGAIREWLDSE